MHCPYCRHTDSKVLDSRVAEDGGTHPPASAVPGLRATVHHRRADAARRRQAQRRGRAVQPRQGDQRRAQGLQGPSGDRGPAGPARPARRGLAARLGSAGDARRTRSAWRSSGRCASWTRWPTCGSPASTGSSARSTTSRPRSPLLRVEQEANRHRAADPGPARRRQDQQLHPAQAHSSPQAGAQPTAAAVGPTDPGQGPRSRGRLARTPPGSNPHSTRQATRDRKDRQRPPPGVRRYQERQTMTETTRSANRPTERAKTVRGSLRSPPGSPSSACSRPACTRTTR